MKDEIQIDHGDHHDTVKKQRGNSDDGVVIELHAKPKPPVAKKKPKTKPKPKPQEPTKVSADEWRKQFKNKEYGVKHEATKATKLPAVQLGVQLTIYRDAYGHYEYLLLKRIDATGAFWQVVTQQVANSDTLVDSLRDATIGQVGIKGFKKLSTETYSYEWYDGQQRGRNIVFAAEVSPTAEVKPDPHKYADFAWLTFEEAVQRVKWSGSKQAFEKLHQHLQAQRLESPATITTGFYGNGSSRVSGPIAQAPNAKPTKPQNIGGVAPGTSVARTGHNPYGDNVPKRLPDVPEDGLDELKPYPVDEDERTGGYLL